MSVTNATKVKKEKFATAKTFQTRKSLLKPEGSIANRQVHTPTAQKTLMSPDERLFIIFMIRGIFHRGRTIEATRAILSIMIYSCLSSAA